MCSSSLSAPATSHAANSVSLSPLVSSSSSASPSASSVVASVLADALRRSHRHSVPTHRLANYLKFLHELSAKASTHYSVSQATQKLKAPILVLSLNCATSRPLT